MKNRRTPTLRITSNKKQTQEKRPRRKERVKATPSFVLNYLKLQDFLSKHKELSFIYLFSLIQVRYDVSQVILILNTEQLKLVVE